MMKSVALIKKMNLSKGIGLNLLTMIAILLGLTALAPIGSASGTILPPGGTYPPPCLTIDQYYAYYKVSLGDPISGEITDTDGIGHYRNFKSNSIDPITGLPEITVVYWKPNTCAHGLSGPILYKYLSKDYKDWEKMGYPKTDLIFSKGKGMYTDFEGGSIFYRGEIYVDFGAGPFLWRARIGTHALTGDIYNYWKNKGGLDSVFGYPMTDVMPSSDDKYDTAYFEQRIIYRNKSTGELFDEYYQKVEPGFGCTPLSSFEGCLGSPHQYLPVITHWNIPNQSTEAYRIDGPIVWSPANQVYPIKLKSGDNVTVSAGGCVQTGGSGSTWHRYVESSETSPRLGLIPGPYNQNYYGSMSIPGSVAGADQAISNYINTPMPIPIKEDTDNNFLLDYYDDQLGGDNDNSYDYHDDGPWDQCNNVGPAWVVVTVEHNRTLPLSPPKAFDVVENNSANVRLYDDNFLLLNPRYGLEVTDSRHPDPFIECGDDLTNIERWTPCTSHIPQFDLASGSTWWAWLQELLIGPFNQIAPALGDFQDLAATCDLFSTGDLKHGKLPVGHVNFKPVTYEGNITWDDKSPKGSDNDMNFFEAQNNSLTLNSSESAMFRGRSGTYPRAVKMEFDADETINHFHTYWWEKILKNDVYSNSGWLGPEGLDGYIRSYLDGNYAIVTGQASIDSEHLGPTELHPIWAMATRLNKSSANIKDSISQDPSDEYWVMFVRNWGDEGFCSSNQHYLGLNSDTYTFRLPWKQGAIDVDPIWGNNDAKLDSFFYSNDIYPEPIAINKVKDQGVQIVFKLSSPHKDGTRINGQLHLHWKYPNSQTQTAQSVIQSTISQIQTTRSVTQSEISQTQFSEQNSSTSEPPDFGPEYYLGKLFSQMTPQQQNILLLNLPKENFSYDEVTSQPIDATWVPEFQTLLQGQTFKPPTVTSEIDKEKLDKDNQTMHAWVMAFGNESAFFKALISISTEASATRVIENPVLHSGDSTNVTVIMKTNMSQPLSLNETLPPGWSLTEISSGGADTFNNNEWYWSNVGTNETRAVIYRLNVPSDAEARTYYINGSFAEYNGLFKPVSGQNTITVVADIHGTKWEDLNADHLKDENETGIAGWEINLKGNDIITGKTVNITTTTDANGSYLFTNLTAGTYVISEKLKDGWVQTTPSNGTYTVTITSGVNITGQDFGNFHKGKITGGGGIAVPKGKATFGLNGQYPDNSSTAQGNVEYHDHAIKLDIKNVQINTVATTLDMKIGVITGLAQVNGAESYPFEIYVEDNAKSGKGADVFKISLPTYPYSNGAVLSGGNIQIHS